MFVSNPSKEGNIMDIKSLSLEERIGQTLIVGLDVPVGKKMYETT